MASKLTPKFIPIVKFIGKENRNRVIEMIARGECIECGKNLWKEFGTGWHIPLCRKDRIGYLKYNKPQDPWSTNDKRN